MSARSRSFFDLAAPVVCIEFRGEECRPIAHFRVNGTGIFFISPRVVANGSRKLGFSASIHSVNLAQASWILEGLGRGVSASLLGCAYWSTAPLPLARIVAICAQVKWSPVGAHS